MSILQDAEALLVLLEETHATGFFYGEVFFVLDLKAYSGILLQKLAGYTLVYLLGAVLASVGC